MLPPKRSASLPSRPWPHRLGHPLFLMRFPPREPPPGDGPRGAPVIVRATPQASNRFWGQPMTVRERHYVQAAYRAGYGAAYNGGRRRSSAPSEAA